MRRCLQLKRPHSVGLHIPAQHGATSPLPSVEPGEGELLESISISSFDFEDPLEQMHIDAQCDLSSLFPTESELETRLPKQARMEAPRRSSETSARASSSGRSHPRFHRCGKCVGCKGRDCGKCQNCADKPRFGGKGVKKQACIARRCINLLKREEREEESDVEPSVPLPSARQPIEDTLGPLRELITPEPVDLGGKLSVGSPTGVIDFPIDGPLPTDFPKPLASPAAAPTADAYALIGPSWPDGLGDWMLDEMPLDTCCAEELPSMPIRGDEFAGGLCTAFEWWITGKS